jgi:anti-sigma B factor antagonist
MIQISNPPREKEERMHQAQVAMEVRKADDHAAIIDIQGELTAFAENVLMEAYHQATEEGARSIVLNFDGLEYMNSSGIGLLVTLLIRINRNKQRLLTYGLSDHYKHIFELTRLDDAIGIYDTENQALQAAKA